MSQEVEALREEVAELSRRLGALEARAEQEDEDDRQMAEAMETSIPPGARP